MTENRVKNDPVDARHPAQNQQPPVNEHFTGVQPGHEHGDQGQKPVKATAPAPQPTDAHPTGMKPGRERGDQGQNPVKTTAPGPQPNDAHPMGMKPGREHGEQVQNPVKAAAPAKPQQAEPQSKQQREHKACSDQDRKEEKCRQ
jgi:hypothetical protein